MAAAVLMTGCSGDPEQVVTPSPTPTETVEKTPSPTPTPSSTALTDEEILAAIPQDLDLESFDSAVYFSQFFLDLYPAMLGPAHDAALFEALSSEDCQFCASALGTVEAQVNAGAHSEGGTFTWTNDPMSDATGGLRDDGYFYVKQPFTVTDTVTYGADGEVLGTEDGRDGWVTTKVTFDAPGWTMHGVNFEQDDA